ncbi:MAG: serine/threonine-protein kinase PknK [Sandaracinaceae bacterium]|nr:serine/threonine-protein kinase PknK [Sandaracinaceae bacterium]
MRAQPSDGEDAVRSSGVQPRTGPPAALPSRFAPVRLLGEGAFGRVWLADDLVRGERVAIKVPRDGALHGLEHVKRELRALGAVAHPGLLGIDELVVEAGACALVMAPLEGTPLDEHLATAPAEAGARFAALLPGIADALGALHAEGVLHLDLKPKNVHVTPDGRPVLLDFGLARTLGETPHAITGTPAYMAPEQARRAPLGPAADWYAVGVMLFEALTARLPFAGGGAETLARKIRQPAPRVAELAPDADPALAALADALLERDPERRWASELVRAVRAPARRVAPFVGREPERARLHALLDGVVARGSTAAALVRAPSGRGKSALLGAFAEDAARAGALVLFARCHPGDHSPFAGLDPLVEALGGALAAQPAVLEMLTSAPDSASLTRMFPSLTPRVEPLPLAGPADPEAHRRALRLLAQGLAQLSALQPIVALIDDAQWGDADAAEGLRELLLGAGRTLFVIGHRDDGTSAFEGALDDAERADVTVERLTLPPLGDGDARALVAALAPDADAAALCDAAAGSPLLLELLARRAATRDAPARAEDLLARELAELSPEARHALALVSVAGTPLPRAVLAHAIGEGATAPAVRALVGRGLARWATARHGAVRDVEVAHDRIALAALDHAGDRRPLHAALDDALEARGVDDAELRLIHARGAGHGPRAAAFARRAAHETRAALAWDRAAALYATALELSPGAPDAGALEAARAECLAAAGRSREAADAFESASEASPAGPERRALARAAAEQLLRGGHLTRGRAAMARALEEIGEPFRSTPATLASLLAHRTWLSWGPPRFAPSRRGSARARVERAEACLAAGIALTNVDSPRGAELVGRALRLAARAGDERLYGRALAYAAAYAGSTGPRAERAIGAALTECERIAARHDDPYVAATAHGARVMLAFALGRYAAGLEHARAARARYLECPGAVRERVTADTYEVAMLARMGRYAEAAARRAEVTRDAQARDDRFVVLAMETGVPLEIELALDRPDRAAAALERSTRTLPALRDGFTVLHFFLGFGRIELALHEGRAAVAQQAVEELARALGRSLLRSMPFLRLSVLELRARAALARGDRATAARAARALVTSGFPWATGVGYALAGMADGSRATLERAASELGALGMEGRALAVRARLGEPTDTALAALGVRAPARYVARLLPR